jgi:hypothetical protein
MRIEMITKLIDDLQQTRQFKKLYNNIIPAWSDVNQFPAVAVLYEKDNKSRENMSNGKVKVDATIPIYIYNRQKNLESKDTLSELVEIVESVVENNEFLRCNTIESIITDFKRDGGLIMPYSVAQLVLKVTYIKKLSNT